MPTLDDGQNASEPETETPAPEKDQPGNDNRPMAPDIGRAVNDILRSADFAVERSSGTPPDLDESHWTRTKRWVAEARFVPRRAHTAQQTITASAEGAIYQAGRDQTVVHVYTGTNSDRDLARAREIFVKSLHQRDAFVGSFLQQALRQAEATFRLSFVFMSFGGIIVLAAGLLALINAGHGHTNFVALISGLGGLLVGTSGAAFSVRADRARKHLATQAERMHSQLLEERRFVKVIDVLSGVADKDLNDKARVAIALRLMQGNEQDGVDLDDADVSAVLSSEVLPEGSARDIAGHARGKKHK